MIDFFPMKVVINDIVMKEKQGLENVLFTLSLIFLSSLAVYANKSEV